MLGLSSESAAPLPSASLSVIVITNDEEANIAQCLAAVSFAREIIVVDSGSTDRTVQLAEAAGAKVLRTADWPGFGVQKSRALAQASQPWVLSIDADESVTPALREEILAAIGAPSSFVAWDIPRRSSFCGRFMAHSGWYPDRVTRLFRRGSAKFSDDLVHERVVADGPVGHLRNDLLHETYPDLETMLQKMDRYSTASARAMFDRGVRSSIAGALAR